MEKENKYYGIIENLVKKHKKFPGLESILEDIIDDNNFLKDTEDYIKECIKYYEYKEKQRRSGTNVTSPPFSI